MKRLLTIALFCLLLVGSAQAAGKRYALVVGVKTYRPGQPLPELAYTESDADGLTAVLKAGGYDVTLMTQTVGRVEGQEVLAPLSDYVRDQLSALLGNPFLKDEDVVLVALAGHGVQYELIDDAGKKTPQFFFCPADADVAKLKTANEVTERNRLLDLGELYAALNECKAGGKLLLVDACRNDPSKPPVARSLASATLPTLPPPPGGTAAFFSCSAHQQAFEDKDLQHGVFFHHVIEALKGDADSSTAKRAADGEITLGELSENVSVSTYDFVRKKYQGAKQAPELKGEFRLAIPLIAVARNRPSPLPVPTPVPGGKSLTSKSTGMTFEPIPAGTFLMGSSAADVAAYLKADPDNKPEYMSDEQPQHSVRITRPFSMGTYEVTQGEYEKITGRNPSYFSATGAGKGKVTSLDTTRFPVEQISWYDAVEYCNLLSEADGLTPYYTITAIERNDNQSIKSATVTPASGSASAPRGYRLPTEAEWEYASRATTSTAFWFGSQNNGKEANINGNFPFGTTTKGPYIERTTTVGQYAKNKFGLYDTMGNTSEWCGDVFDEKAYAGRSGTTDDPEVNASAEDRRVLRGGSWYGSARSSRSAYRYGSSPDIRTSFIGFRVVRTQ